MSISRNVSWGDFTFVTALFVGLPVLAFATLAQTPQSHEVTKMVGHLPLDNTHVNEIFVEKRGKNYFLFLLRASEMLALRWSDILWEEERIRVCKRWARGGDGETKTDASDAYVPMHTLLAGHLRAWHGQTPYAKEADFVFPSFKARGRAPISASIFVADHLRPAAKKAGVQIEDGQRFGLHNLRHSLSNRLVNKAKIEPKTVQGILRHSKIQTTLDLYAQGDGDETRAAQGKYLTALRAATQVLQ